MTMMTSDDTGLLVRGVGEKICNYRTSLIQHDNHPQHLSSNIHNKLMDSSSVSFFECTQTGNHYGVVLGQSNIVRMLDLPKDISLSFSL